MTFDLLPIMDKMIELYEQPLTPARFQAYLRLLQGARNGDMTMPIGGFNPMAKGHVLEQLRALKTLGLETIIADCVQGINTTDLPQIDAVVSVAFNLADDLRGGWTNRYSTDYDSRFKINALVERDFCTPYFWTSETVTAERIRRRTLAAVYRTVYYHQNGKCITLREHLEQEAWVAERCGHPWSLDKDTQRFFNAYADSDDHAIIFNCLYGDQASAALGYRQLGGNGLLLNDNKHLS